MVTTLLACPVLLRLPALLQWLSLGRAFGPVWGTVPHSELQGFTAAAAPHSTQALSRTPCDSHPCEGGNGPSGPAHVLSPSPRRTALPRPVSHELPVLFPVWEPMAGFSLTGF